MKDWPRYMLNVRHITVKMLNPYLVKSLVKKYTNVFCSCLTHKKYGNFCKRKAGNKEPEGQK